MTKFFHSALSEKNQVVLITGASGTIGSEIARLLSRQYAHLVLLSRHITHSPIFNLLHDNSHNLFIDADMTSQEEVENSISSIRDKFGRIDVLINCVGIFRESLLEDTSLAEYENIMDVNIKSMYLVTKNVIPIMKKQREGLIVNFGSKISRNPNIAPKRVLYTAAKYAVEGFSTALRKELVSYGIRVTCLLPATVNSGLFFQRQKHLSPDDVALFTSLMIKCRNIEFENVVFQSKKESL